MENIVLQMMNFQHFNKIRGAHATNAKCLRDLIIKSCPDKKTEVYPAIVTSINDDNTESQVVINLIVLVDDSQNQTLLDPSYDVFSLENKRYYLNIKEFVDAIENPSQKQNELKSLAKKFMMYLECANQINSGDFDSFNRELYEKQTEYVNLTQILNV
jgi:hypothetical protein